MDLRVLFLAFGSPWPETSGAALRSFGIVKQLARHFAVDLLVASRQPATAEQHHVLRQVASSVRWLLLRDRSRLGALSAATRSLVRATPYHCALLEASVAEEPALLDYIHSYPGIVFTSHGHWGTLVRRSRSANWVLNQCDADVDFWRIYRAEQRSRVLKAVAAVNHALARVHYPAVYSSVGAIVSVCAEDATLTRQVCTTTPIHVLQSGVDCRHYAPAPDGSTSATSTDQLLFTGTDTRRNMAALHWLVHDILPRVWRCRADVQLIVGGRFSRQNQKSLSRDSRVIFTGPLRDIRPVFAPGRIFVAPFRAAYGSKLKVIQAMAMQLPIVSTPAGVRGLPVEHGETALIARTEEEFAAAILQLIDEPVLTRRIALRARATAAALLDVNAMGDRLKELVIAAAGRWSLQGRQPHIRQER
jgi:polysaccharide biosynthesis protein PslH